MPENTAKRMAQEKERQRREKLEFVTERWYEDVYAVAFERKLDFVIVKGISHYADEGESEIIKEWKIFSSVMAASFVQHILMKNPTVLKNLPHYNGIDNSNQAGQQLNNPSSTIGNLQLSTKQLLCTKLNIKHVIGGDYRELAAHFSMSGEDLDVISQEKNPTEEVLKWTERNPENTIAKLREILIDMKRADCVDILDKGHK